MSPRRLLPVLIISLFFRAAAVAASNPYGIPDKADAELKEGLRDLFNMRFDDADRRFQALQKQASDHPIIALAAAVVPWWRMTASVLERDDAESRPFVEAAERCLQISEKKLKRDKRGEAHVAMGTALGLMSRWSAANRAWLPAYTRGSRSSNLLNAALKANPNAVDAYMTLGTFNYARELIRRHLNSDTDRPDDQATGEGLRQLERAYREASYFRQAAGMLYAGILTNESPAAAIPILHELRADLPESAFVHMVLVTALYNAGRAEELETEAADLLAKTEAGAYPKTVEPHARFAVGLVSFRKGRWKDAAADFGLAIQNGVEANPYYTWAHLYQGYCYDALGLRTKARERYRDVLRLKPRYASHERARERLQKAFKKTDVEMRKVEL